MVLVARTRTIALTLGALGFLHARRLPLQVAEEVQLGASHPCRPHEVDLGDRRRVQREDALDTLAERHLANGEGGSQAATVQPDDDALEDLDALLVALAHLDVHADGVSRLHVRPLGHLGLFGQLNRGHCYLPSPNTVRLKPDTTFLDRATLQY